MMYVIRLLILLSFYAVTVSSGQVEQTLVDPCAEAMTTAQMRTCLNVRYTKADDALNEAYNLAMEGLNETRRAKLREAQNAWIEFRDKSAEFEASIAEGGSLSRLIELETLVAMTRERAQVLEAVAANGD